MTHERSIAPWLPLPHPAGRGIGGDRPRLAKDDVDYGTSGGTDGTATARTARVTVLGDVALRSVRRGDIHTIQLFGRLEAPNADGVQLELQRLETGDASSIIIDLSSLESIDATGVQLLLRARARSQAHEKCLTLTGATAALRRALEQSGAADVSEPRAPGH